MKFLIWNDEDVDRTKWYKWVDPYLEARPHHRDYINLIIRPPTMAEVVVNYPEAARESELAAGEIRFARNAHDGHGHGLTVLALYLISREADSPHGFAMMCAIQQAPGLETSDTFWAGRQRFDQVYGEMFANTIKTGFAKKGINFKNGDEYCPELARPEYSVHNPDPEAILPFSDARGRIKKLCQQRGWECSGAVTVKHREPLLDPHAPENCVPLAEDIVAELASGMVRKNPDLMKKSKNELREMVVEKHGPPPR